jgi:hypothetical protein
MRSYLDDPEHDWSIDPTAGDGTSLNSLMNELCSRLTEEEELQIIFRGYAGLKMRYPEASDPECLQTSMIWYYG